ncbi:ribonuclease Z [Candidatus Pacearchaeota archaeon]|nr:ribonuclease Z [Candidatus Pacearchaeota archaeon]
MIDLTFLGTGQAVPTDRRNHSAILLKYEDECILIDCGEGTQRQFRKAKLNPCSIIKLLITHWHGDHILGIPGLLQTLVLNGYNKELEIFGPVGTKKYLDAILNMFIFVGKIKIKIYEIEQEGPFYENSFILESYKLKHSTPCLAYVFREKDKRKIEISKIKKLGIKGKDIGVLQKGNNLKLGSQIIKPEEVSYMEKGKKICIILDTGFFDMRKIAENADLLIAESTYTKELEEKASEYSHMTAEQAAQTAKSSNAKKLILTHISQRYEKDEKEMLKEARKTFKNTEIAEDLMKFKV